MVGRVRIRSENCAASRPKAFSCASALPRTTPPSSTKKTTMTGTVTKQRKRRLPRYEGHRHRREQWTDRQHGFRRAVADHETGKRARIALQSGHQRAGGLGANARAATSARARPAARLATDRRHVPRRSPRQDRRTCRHRPTKRGRQARRRSRSRRTHRPRSGVRRTPPARLRSRSGTACVRFASLAWRAVPPRRSRGQGRARDHGRLNSLQRC